MKRERLTDREVLEEVVGKPHFNINHLDYLERMQLGLPEEENEAPFYENEGWPEMEHYWYPGDFEKEYPQPDWDPGLKEHIKPPYLHEIEKNPSPDSPNWEDSDYHNLASLKKR